MQLRSVRSHALDLAYHSHILQQADQQVQRTKSTAHSLRAARNQQHLIRYRAVKCADNPSPLDSPQARLAHTREQLLTAKRMEERHAARLGELQKKEDKYERLVDSCDGALSRVTEGGLEARQRHLLEQIEERKQLYMREEMESTVINTGLELQIAAMETQIAKMDQLIAQAHQQTRQKDFQNP
jgi:hypothetical protein